ncbi:MAG: DNA gyrase subunit A [Planctomycetota bacterium]|nr:MAG: DNA gyrase subunit A [Planctomycetota bacterium]
MADPTPPSGTPDERGEEGSSIRLKNVSEEMHHSYMQYAMSVIKSRALPDVRDGLKPSQRRVLYTMASDLNLLPTRQRVKSARVVGEAMGKYHPHGDSAIYMTLVRMAQDFASRYVLVDKKGNFGSITDPQPAAMRYTECRMAWGAVHMVADINEDTVDMVPNYDNRDLEPVVLPSKFPNLLCNGSQGIAVGMATSIPPHNLQEVTNALIAIAERGDEVSDAELLRLVPGPDFPTGGIICGTAGIRSAYLTGRGAITVRGKVEIEETKTGRARIVITELPYQVTTEALREKINAAHRAGRVVGLADIKDHSAKGQVRVLLPCKKGEDPHVILNQLYKHTPLQTTFSIIMIALEPTKGGGMRPVTFTLRGLLSAFKQHRYQVIRRRTRYRLEKARARIHILEGLAKALDALDDVISIIRNSATTDEAREGLRERLAPLSKAQANAILEMRLARLTGMERGKLLSELEELRKTAADLEDILAREERVRDLFVSECREVADNLRKHDPGNDARRTVIDASEAGDLEEEDLIAVEDCIVTVTHKGYIKRTALDAYRLQRRSGKGMYGASTRDDDFVTNMFLASTKDYVLAFTSKGRVHWIKVYRIPEGSRTSRGRGLRNLIALLPDETVTSLIRVQGEFDADRYLVMATRQGVIKKTQLSAFKNPRKAGVVAVKIDEGDALVGVRVTNGGNELVLASRNGKAVRFHEEEVRPMGRTARGVRGMQLGEGDEVVALVVAGEEGPNLLTVCELGYGKQTPVEDYRQTRRGVQGVINAKLTEKTGRVVGMVAVQPGDQVMLITSSGKLIRAPVDDVRTCGRATQGVRIIRVDEGEHVVAIARVAMERDAGEDHEEASAE